MKKIVMFLILFINQVYSLEITLNDIGQQPPISGQYSIGDLNGDGFNDIFVSGLVVMAHEIYSICPPAMYCYHLYAHGPTGVLINDKKGGFNNKEQGFEFIENIDVVENDPYIFSQGMHQFYPVIADVDNDGDNDVISSDGRIYLNDGHASFSVGIIAGYLPSDRPIYTLDVDNDGVLEILSSSRIYKRTNTHPIAYELIDEAMPFNANKHNIIDDFNLDGYQDILTYGFDSFIKIWMNDGAGNYTLNNLVTLSEKEDLQLVSGDIDNDGDMDLVLSNNKYFENTGESNFELKELFTENDDELRYLPKKFIKHNNDEFSDLFVTIENNDWSGKHTDQVLINNGNGQFSYGNSRMINEARSFNGLVGTHSLTGDFNNNGFADFITTNFGPIKLINNESYSRFFQLSDYIDSPIHSTHLNLYLNDTKGFIKPNINTMVSYSKPYLFNYDNKSENEMLLGNYQNNPYDNNSNSIARNPVLVSDINNSSQLFNEIILEDCQNYYNNQRAVIPVDVNNDGLDDLLVNYYGFDPSCESGNKVYLNSSTGIDRDTGTDIAGVNFSHSSFIGDFNGDGYQDIYTPFSSFIHINNKQNGFESKPLIDSNFGAYARFFKDINNDGMADIILLDIHEAVYVIYGQTDLDNTSVELVYSGELSAISLYDYDSDGFLDMFVFKPANGKISQLKNNNGQFVQTFDYISFSDNDIGSFEVLDIDKDGQLEVFIPSSLSIVSLDTSRQYEVIFAADREYYSRSAYLIHDFDGDGLDDIWIGGKVLFGREFKFYPGLNYDPVHNGHGFSIENVAEDQFFTVFYTYDSDGNPEWLSSLGIFENFFDEDYWNIAPTSDGYLRSEYDYTSQSMYQNTSNTYLGSIIHGNCSEDFGPINLLYSIGVLSIGIPIEQGQWCSQPIVAYENRPITDDMSGLWWAGQEESGWGWSVELYETETGTDMVVILYYYDAQGNPRWLIGQQSGFQAGQEITLDMNMVQGYGRSSPVNDLQQIPAGTMSLTLNQASSNILSAGTVSVDLTYPGDESGHWVRDNIPIALFSKPRR